MNIGFDAKRAFFNNSGLGNYSRSVIESLAQFAPDDNFFLFSPKPSERLNMLFLHKNLNAVYPNGIRKFLWRSIQQVEEWTNLNLHIYHGLSNELPFSYKKPHTKKIVTIHDLIFKTHPQLYNTADRLIYSFKVKHAVTTADRIICVSNETRNNLLNEYDADENKTTVIYPALTSKISTQISTDKAIELCTKYHLPDNYLLHIGTIEPRKNLLNTIKALHSLGKDAPPLVVAGRKTEYLNFINKYVNSLNNPPCIQFVFSANDEEINILYSRATAFIYPSIAEGFGIPVIEAAAHGIPCITTINSCMQEAAGRGALFVNPASVDEISDAIRKLFSDNNLRAQLSTLSKLNAARFSFQQTALALLKSYQF